MRLAASLAGLALVTALAYPLAGGLDEALRIAVLTAVVMPAAVIDARRGIVPNGLVLVGLVTGMASCASAGAFLHGAAAGLAAGAALLACRGLGMIVFGRPGMGMGDVKLAAVLGLLLGWNVFLALYLAAVFGGAVSAIGLATGRLHRFARIPFAPFMAAGALLEYFVSPLAGMLPW